MPEPADDPALVFGPPEASGPGTHVLAIGMQNYPHLAGGQSHVAGRFEGMGQLPSAARSARAVVGWFLEHFTNGDQPLASVALVLSEPGPAMFSHARLPGPVTGLPRGSVQEAMAAIKAWARRAASHPDNLAVLYFCGHGVSFAAGQLLLCSDFAASPGSDYQASINLSNLTAALGTRRPRQQLILADCCREPVHVAQSIVGQVNLGQAVLDPVFGHAKSSTRLSAHTSTSDMSKAFGRRSGLTFFAEALIKAFDGGGVQSDMGDWVGTLGLQAALAAYVLRASRAAKVEQEPEIYRYGRFKLHKPQVVGVPLHVACEPRDAIHEGGAFEVLSTGGARTSFTPSVAGEELWSPILSPDDYDVGAVFGPDAPWISTNERVKLYPPEASCELRPNRRRHWLR